MTDIQEQVLTTLQGMLAKRGVQTERQDVGALTFGEKEAKDLVGFMLGEVMVVYSTKAKGITKPEFENIVTNFGGKDRWLIVVSRSPPSENLLNLIKTHAKHRVQFFHVKQLMFDITTHRMAVPHRIIKEVEKDELYKRYKITDPMNQLPWIDSQDPMVKWVGGLPQRKEGDAPRDADILEITRHSDVSGKSLYYRIVVDDVNIA